MGGMPIPSTRRQLRGTIIQLKKQLSDLMDELKNIRKERQLTVTEKARMMRINRAGRAVEQLEKLLPGLAGPQILTRK